MTATEQPALSDIHRAYLNGHAITDAVIEAQGIRSDGDFIVFPWRDGAEATEQRRRWLAEWAASPELDQESPKYLWGAKPLHLNAARDPGPDAAVLLCEGTKQHLAVASWAPPEYAVYGMQGCRGASRVDLACFAGRQVIIWFDADAAENLDVYEAGEKLAGKLDLEGAQVFFARPPSAGKEGIDDYLAEVAADRRTAHLAKLAADAVANRVTKPAPRRPARRKVPEQLPDTDSRPMTVVNKDRLSVIHEINGAIRMRWDGRELFCYGGALTRLRNGKTEPLDRDAYLRWLPEAVSCYKYTPPGMTSPGKYEAAWPERETISALLASGDEFAPLDRVARVPFLRPDGTVCAKNGYDPVTRTMLVTGNSGMDRIDVPEFPSQADAATAAAYLLDSWLGPGNGGEGMPFRDATSRANALALILTPFVRGLVPLVPLCVVSGLQMGVGKNLLADCLSIVVTGEACVPLPWVADDDDEIRKQILSAFRSGSSLLCFDEAHDIESIALSRALTAITYTDRILGVSKMASYLNQVTWMALGNNVRIDGDMMRRQYRIELYPEAPDPQDRDEQSFAHPDLRGWTSDNRPELVTAALTLLRAWFTAGCPQSPRGSLMGSFEAWDKMMSGALGYAEIPGFLSTLIEQRAGGEHSAGYWEEHLGWSARVWSNAPHTCPDVKKEAQVSLGNWCAPPELDLVMQEGYARKLGQAYARVQDRWFGPYRIVKVGKGHGNVVMWSVETREINLVASETVPPVPPIPPKTGISGGTGGTGGSLLSTQVRAREFSLETTEQNRTGVLFSIGTGEGGPPVPPVPPTPPVSGTRAGLALSIDLETASADELFRYTQRDETGYVRLAGALGPDGVPAIMTAAELLPLLDAAAVIAGHNVIGFDLVALARHHGADYARLAAKARDSELIARQVNPPRSRDTGGPLDRYGLDEVAGQLGVAGKTDSLARLQRAHGGYDKIPVDDPEYRGYLEGDLRATAAVAERLGGWYDSDPYLPREHRLAAIAGRMALNGFLVDGGLLEERYAAGQARKRECLQLLRDGWGLPLTKTVTRGRGKNKTEHEEPSDSPLGTDAGRAWLAGIWERYGVADPPRTANTGKLAIGNEELKAVAADPRCPAGLKAVLALMAVVVGTRTVYQTARDTLCPDGRVHPTVSMRQASGRWSVTNPGLTVFGKRGGKHVERDIFLPDPGHVLLSFDLSQVDMRAMAWLSGDHAYRAMFAPGRDAHAEIGAQVGLSRQDAKMVGHGWNYGLSVSRMIREGMDPVMVHAFDDGMRARFPALIAWREGIRAAGGAGEILLNGFGRRMMCDPSRAYTVAPALMGQGGARDIMCESLLRLPRELDQYLRVMVHDEIVCSVPREDVMEVAAAVKRAMTWQLDDDLPVLCDMAAGFTWGEVSAK